MPLRRTAALVGVALLVWAFGPLVLLVSLGSLGSPRVRAWWRPTRRVVGAWAVGVVAAAGILIVVPDGWVPIPSGAGVLASPAYVGRPVRADPIDLAAAPHERAGAVAWAGPSGESPRVDTAWFGPGACTSLVVDRAGWLLVRCGGDLRVVDPGSLRVATRLELPSSDGCVGGPIVLDADDRALLTTADRRVLVLDPLDGEDPDAGVAASYDLSAVVPADDCLVAVSHGGVGLLWWATRDGRVGTIAEGRAPAALDLGEPIAGSLSVDADGAAYVVTAVSLQRLRLGRRGAPVVVWRRAYDPGTGSDAGRAARGPAPTLLPSGLVAITDRADSQAHVQFHRRADGDLVCQEPVFAEGASALPGELVSLGTGVVVVDHHGAGPWRTLLGRSAPAGLTRVDVVDGECVTRWASDQPAPSSSVAVALPTGLAYAWTHRRNLLGVSAWHLTAMSARTGRTVWSVRAGIGAAFDNRGSGVTIAPDGAAYVLTAGGLVRVRDRG